MSLTLKQSAFLTASSITAVHYDLRIKGSLPKTMPGCLFLVLNHSSLSDPLMVARAIGLQGYHARFVSHVAMYERNKWIMDQMGALPLPSTFDGKGDWTQEKIRRSIERIHTAVANGENVAIYPSGQLKAGEYESLGGKSLTFDILKRYPQTPVVIIEIRGLMYSLSSRWFTGGIQSPSKEHMREIVMRAPLRFMTERLPVEVTFHSPQVLPTFDSARALNAYLEGVVNARPDFGPAWRKELRTEADLARYLFARTAEEVARTPLDPAVSKQVLAHLASLPEVKTQGLAADQIGPDMNLISNLGLDSLAEVSLRGWAEDTFGVTIDGSVQILTVRDLIVACQGALAEVANGDAPVSAPRGWLETGRREAAMPGGETIPEAAILQAYRQGLDKVYTFDPTATHFIRKSKKKPLVTYRDLLKRAIIVARLLQRELPDEERIACLLPATPGAAAFTLGVLLAGKVLVPLNWTNGPAALDASIVTAGVNVVFTSELFLEKAAVALSPLAISKVLLAEEFRKRAGVGDLIAAMHLVGQPPRAILNTFGYSKSRDDVAVILFTSGSESTPKGVPLTHGNLLSNIEGGLDVVGGRPNDVLFAFLPPFHSFGLVQLMLMSLVVGVKVIYSPDPMKFKQLATTAEKFGVTLLAGTPDFLSGILDAVRGNEQRLASVRTWLSGAQKAPAELRARVAKLGATLIEGYGITETAPLLCANRRGEPPVGVGRPINGTTIAVVDIETMSTRKETGQEGLILATGPGVFNGYIGSTSEPFATLDGKRWYNTGDLGHVDAHGNLTISGRLKRFLKPFGEMVNLTAVEDALASAYPGGEEGPRVAVTGVEVPGKRAFIVLHTTEPTITTEAANKVIKAAGLTNLSFVDHIECVTRIPLLGSGKTNHRALRDAQAILDVRNESAVRSIGAVL
ncbi:MAG: AMP-binding protein [Hyphomicrobiaceae bacterium]|nr:AMP-binding protein [Hyphomicrobiaceae bacterium]